MTATVHAPLPGVVRDLVDVPDPVFAAAMVGRGVAIEPAGDATVTVTAPVSGVLTALHPHAFVVVDAAGRGVLVHLGVDTVELHGAGFTTHATRGQVVRQGSPLVTWSPRDVALGGRSTLCPVIALDAEPDAVTSLVGRDALVAQGTPLLRWG